ncbi:MAG TPA: hypothetical protein VNO33_13965 [Kofleriaceae bacterium]|nr:hypothetical protein [Kofleriaceae bacterium]
MNKHDSNIEKLSHAEGAARPLARIAARELSQADIAAASATADTTHATGPNGDDPSDPDWGL